MSSTISGLGVNTNYNVQSTDTSSSSTSSTQQTHKHHHHKQGIDSLELSSTGISSLTDAKKKSPLDDLVANGTITQDQADAVKAAVQAARQGQTTQASGTSTAKTNPLDSLVSAGTITQDQENSVMSAIQAHHHHHGSQGSDGKPTNPLDSLVKAGTITQDQEDSIQKAFEEARKAFQKAHATQAYEGSSSSTGSASNSNPLTKILDGLVTSGTLTQDQEDSITSAFQAAWSNANTTTK